MKTAIGSSLLACGAVLMLLAGTSRADSDPARDGVVWHIETVDTSGAGKFSSLKVDKDGNVHVAYSIEDGNVYPLKYAIRTVANQRWFTMPLAKGAGVCSLVLDSKQRPHISWDDYGSGVGAKLRYAHWDGQTWKIEAIRVDSEVVSYYNSIALDPHDNPAISFYEYQGPRDTDFRIRLRVVRWDGNAWNLRTVDGQPGSGKFNAMVADSKGHLHLAYANVSAVTAGIRYAYWDGESWKVEILEGVEQTNGDNVGFSANIALDKQENPHLTYMDESTPLLKYAAREGGRWKIQTIDSVSRIAYPDRNSIAFDDEGHVYIGYYDPGSGVLKLAHQEGSRWMSEVVDTNGGFTSSMEISHGTIWISYADERGALKVAHRDLAAAKTPGASPAESPERKK